ncbi:MAG: glycosyltransferase family 39 protein [Alphaproteobacteria bacterium]|nr:glycosyltransferase family 39 protein [Alphaproteobacteria bacterium]
MISRFLPGLFVPVALCALFLTAIVFRPLLPIDETRYMSVAWEMWLRGDWLAPLTLNFELYHHKPPFLFWAINAAWSVFGVSRGSALIPIFLASLAFVYLTHRLARTLFDAKTASLIPYLTVGSLPFLLYGTLVMFDITLSVFILSSLLALLSYARTRHPAFLLWMALAMGIGVLTKGPVMWLYVIFPVFLAPVWLPALPGKTTKKGWLSWYGGCALAFFLSTVPVLLWLIPVLKASDPDFAFWLIWEQTAGRISGNMGSSHARPIYFYLPFLPVLFLPWMALPSFWRGLPSLRDAFQTQAGVRFIACWVIPVFIAFSLISGKQPHYMLPLLPGILLFFAARITTPVARLRIVASGMVAALILFQVISSQTIFKKYDLRPIASYVQAHEDKDWAFVRKYQGEITFLGRLQKSFAPEEHGTLAAWFAAHPGGLAVVRYTHQSDIAGFDPIMTMSYRGRNIGVFQEKPATGVETN